MARGSLLRPGLVDRLRLMVFPQILGETGQEPFLTGLPDINLRLGRTQVLDNRLVLLEYPARGSQLRPAARTQPGWPGCQVNLPRYEIVCTLMRRYLG